MIPEAGQRFGPYEILGRLGSGGMGLVFRAWDERLHREVAVKLLHDDYKMPAMRERFLQEARAASALNHPNICTVFDIGEQDGDPYLVMELLEGETLKERIARGALTGEEISRYGEEISNALAVAHAKGIVHRDIKPANIFLVNMPNGKSQAKVLDFGLAKIGLAALGGWGSRTLDLTLAGSTVGTLAYMSPEQAKGESLDARSDLFSLGIVMYEMATRQVPFKGTTSALIFVQLLQHAPEPVRNWNESISAQLERVIMKLLTKDRKGRFQTAKELQETLGKISKKLNKGGWLTKGTVAAVPLVRAADPVARQKRPSKSPAGAKNEGGASPQPTPRPISSADNILIRPAHVPIRERTELARKMQQHVEQSAVATVSGEMPAIVDGLQIALGADSDLSSSAIPRRESILARSRSGVTQFEYGLDDSDEYRSLSQATTIQSSEVEYPAVRGQQRRKIVLTTLAALVAAAAVSGIFLMARAGEFQPVVLRPNDRLFLTTIQNRTGDKTLDGTVMQGLEIELRQSESLNLFASGAYLAGLRQLRLESGDTEQPSAQYVAAKVGATAYLYGEITGTKAPYTISIDVLKTKSNDKLTNLQETAASREEIPAAIGRLAQALLEEVQGDGKAGARTTVPLEQQATANVEALHEYAVGEEAMASDRAGDALTAYQHAAALDPKFPQAQMRLAWLYRTQRAEVAAASAAGLAKTAASHADNKMKLLAQFCYEINGSGDYGRALETIQKFVSRYPRDVEGMKGLALVLALRGRWAEALLAAQQGNSESAYDAGTYTALERALIGADRYDDALQLAGQAERLGVLSGESVLAAAYLGGKDAVVEKLANSIQPVVVAQGMDTRLISYGLSLDNSGKLTTGTELWTAAATQAAKVPEFASTQASMLAQGALDRALTESCSDALKMANAVQSMERGPDATFKAGIAAALCGDKTYAERSIEELRKNFPQNSAVIQYYVQDLEAAAELGANEPPKALEVLMSIGQYDEVSLTPYLRGLAHAATGQAGAAVNDFQTVLAHRGSAFLLGSNVYPMAEFGLARAFATSGNKDNSVTAYRRFLKLWSAADSGNHLTVEATAKSR